MNQNNKISLVSWRELRGNKFNRAISPLMLSSRGMLKNMFTRVRSSVRCEYIVRYDRQYVIEWLAYRVISKLKDTVGYDDFCALLAEAWKLNEKEFSQKNIPFADAPTPQELQAERKYLEYDSAEENKELARAIGWGRCETDDN
jgi:hypothetical protein